MGWFTKTKSIFNVLPAPPNNVPHSTFAASTITYGVDPPRLSGYQMLVSPPPQRPPPGVPEPVPELPPAVTIMVSELEAIEAVPPPAQGNRRDSTGGLSIDFVNLPASPVPSETEAGVDHASALPRHASFASPWTSTNFNHYSYPLPSETTVVNQPSILPPTQTVNSPTNDSLSKPTCSLNLTCYRSGSQGCIRRQIQVSSRIRWTVVRRDRLEKFGNENPDMVCSDQQFFHALHQEYEQNICGFWRRHLSLKTLRKIRLLSYTTSTRPEIVPIDDFTLQEVFYAYQHPESIKTEQEWIEWVFRLRQKDRRHALEFVEGWSGFRIGLIGSVPCVVASVVGIAWTARGGDAQTAFTVAAFILTVGTSLLALLAIVSKIES